MKTIIERGASWTLEETKLLLALWGQDLVQRQATNQKRTKEVYEKIAEKFTEEGFERTADQVRTRVFNMIAEYRRILKDPSPDRIRKCVFFEPLHRIYQAKHMDDVKSALDDYEPVYPCSPDPEANTISSEKGDESISDNEVTDGNEAINNNTTQNNSNAAASSLPPTATVTAATTTTTTATTSITTATTATTNNGTAGKKIKLQTPNQAIQVNPASTPASNSSSSSSTQSLLLPNATAIPRLPTNTAITSHRLYQAPVNTFDVTSSALLIDRMFAHLSRESENMREWIALEKERLALERARRQQEAEREARRERILIDTLMRFQDQWLSYLTRVNSKSAEGFNEAPPELKMPPKEGQLSDTPQSTQTTAASASSNDQNPSSDAGK